MTEANIDTATMEKVMDAIQRWQFLNGEPRVVRLRADVMNKLNWEVTFGKPCLDLVEMKTFMGLPVETVYRRDAEEVEILGWR